MRARGLLYGTNLTLLATHQVDAAYWHEWEVFGVPGGITFFLVFNLAAMLLLTAGLASVTTGHRLAQVSAFAGAAIGLFTCALHAVFLARDPVAFWSPISLSILGGILLTSVAALVNELAGGVRG